MNNPLFFLSAGDERGTPQSLFDTLNTEFHFDLDAAATSVNAKCDLYFGEGGIAANALTEDWGGTGSHVFLNPPYSQVGAFVMKAREEANKGALVVLLLPVRSDTRWWHQYIWNRHTTPQGHWYPGIEIRFLPGRLNFELRVPATLRAWIQSELKPVEGPKAFQDAIHALVSVTGLPKMAIERIYLGQPDNCLLDSAPFPSCVVVMSHGLPLTLAETPSTSSPDLMVPSSSVPPIAEILRVKRKYTRRQR